MRTRVIFTRPDTPSPFPNRLWSPSTCRLTFSAVAYTMQGGALKSLTSPNMIHHKSHTLPHAQRGIWIVICFFLIFLPASAATSTGMHRAIPRPIVLILFLPNMFEKQEAINTHYPLISPSPFFFFSLFSFDCRTVCHSCFTPVHRPPHLIPSPPKSMPSLQSLVQSRHIRLFALHRLPLPVFRPLQRPRLHLPDGKEASSSRCDADQCTTRPCTLLVRMNYVPFGCSSARGVDNPPSLEG